MAQAELMPLQGYHHIEFYVGNAKQAATYYRTAFGFTPVAYAGPETGVRDRASWVLAQGDVRFVLTAGLSPEHEAVRHQLLHGDGVKDVAFRVPDAERAFAVALERGAQAATAPQVREDERGKVVLAAIKAYGDTIHTFVDASNYSGVFLPGYEPVSDQPAESSGLKTPLYAKRGVAAGLKLVDHVVANVELGKMDTWVDFYASVMGFTQLRHFDDRAISTEYSALMSKVLWDGEGRIKLPINEPARGKRKSQIEEYLEYYGSPGVQHLALATDDIVATVAALRGNGVRFMRVPPTYYEEQRERLDWSTIDEVQDRPTLFYEVIERHGCRGFGEGNFKALFEAIEREQAARGNL
jgi:4-hydroxyphenylpyruvate dioxygenase